MATFIHDHVFLKYDNQFYTSGSLNKEVMRRYIDIFGNIRLVTRCREVKEVKDGLEPSSIQNAEFVCVPNFKSITKIANYFKARKIIKEEVIKAEYILLRTSSFANIAARYARKYNKSYLVEVVGCAWDASWNYSLLGKFIAPFSFIFQRRTVKQADYAIYVTNKFLQSRYPTNGKNIGCSDVELPFLDDSILDNRLSKIRNMQRNEPIIIGTTAAVNVRYKGQEYVIKAISKLNKEGYNFEYNLPGGGDNSYLKSVAEKYCVPDKVKFLGSLPHDKVFQYLDNIDIYIQPSKQEGLPRALVEAMSRACPSLGSITGGIPELLNDEFIFHNGAVNEICELLKKMDKEIMLKEAKRSFKKAKEYNKIALDEKRNEFYEKFIEKRK